MKSQNLSKYHCIGKFKKQKNLIFRIFEKEKECQTWPNLTIKYIHIPSWEPWGLVTFVQ